MWAAFGVALPADARQAAAYRAVPAGLCRHQVVGFRGVVGGALKARGAFRISFGPEPRKSFDHRCVKVDRSASPPSASGFEVRDIPAENWLPSRIDRGRCYGF